MAVTEPRDTQPVSGPPPADGPTGAQHRPRRRRWALAGLATLLITALVVLAVLADTYQPIREGGESGGTLPGLPAGTGLRDVNTFGFQTGQVYVPPQLGAFTVVESIQNTGSEAVTIVAVSLLDPRLDNTPPWPLSPAGPARGYIDTEQRGPVTVRPVAGLSLAAGQTARIGIPVRLSGGCYDLQSFTRVDSFYVEERLLTFTHWVAVPLATPLLFRQPAYPGQEPANDVTCLAK